MTLLLPPFLNIRDVPACSLLIEILILVVVVVATIYIAAWSRNILSRLVSAVHVVMSTDDILFHQILPTKRTLRIGFFLE